MYPYLQHQLANKVQYLSVNFHLVRRPRSNPTPALTLTPNLWGARGRQERSSGSATCIGGVFQRKTGGSEANLDQSDSGVDEQIYKGGVEPTVGPFKKYLGFQRELHSWARTKKYSSLKRSLETYDFGDGISRRTTSYASRQQHPCTKSNAKRQVSLTFSSVSLLRISTLLLSALLLFLARSRR